ncbi:MAG: hypothetical protein U5K54_08425 [Cytophagales bacterium]|nr:hypothetical protein [Cytophagales bacterium]
MKIQEKVIISNFVLIGEDHFMNEVPPIVSAISKTAHFDNLFIELDAYSTEVIANRLKTRSSVELNKFVKEYSHTFSFYNLQPEFNLLKEVIEAKTNVYGTEQVFLFSDKLIFDDLLRSTSNEKAREIYRQMSLNSVSSFEKLKEDINEPFYMLSDEYGKQLATLLALQLSEKEMDVLKDISLSRKIYIDQSHALRIQLMKQQMLENITALQTQKNLFKYGANHMTSGESLLRIYDLGNLVSNIADSRFEKSVHIMIVGKNGEQGVGLPGQPSSKLDPDSGDLSFLKPFFDTTNSEEYHTYDLVPIRKEVIAGKIQIDNKSLLRTIMGYDFLVIIPDVTAAKVLDLK